MSFGLGVASSATSGGLNTFFSSANAVHQYEADHSWMAAIDPLGSAFGHVLNSSEKKSAQKQMQYARKIAKLNYEYQKRSALEMPSLVRQGYEDAGYNALLAFNGGSVTSASPSGDGSAYPHIEKTNRAGIDPLLAASLRQADAQIEQTKAQTMKTKVSTYTDALGSALGFGGLLLAVKKLGKKGLTSAVTNARGSAIDKLVDIPLKSGNRGQVLGKLAVALPMLGRLGLYGAGVAGGLYGYNKFLDYVQREGGVTPIRKDHPRLRHEMGTWLKSKTPVRKRKHN